MQYTGSMEQAYSYSHLSFLSAPSGRHEEFLETTCILQACPDSDSDSITMQQQQLKLTALAEASNLPEF